MGALRKFIAISTLFAPAVTAGPAAYGVCQVGCAAVVMACYSAASFTWGATMGASAPASIMACTSASGQRPISTGTMKFEDSMQFLILSEALNFV
jgi:hypothetical protein